MSCLGRVVFGGGRSSRANLRGLTVAAAVARCLCER
jgi:hypothetical protein